jgi:putative transposase
VVEPTMDISGWLRKQLEQASPDLLRAMVQEFAEALMSAEADALCGDRMLPPSNQGSTWEHRRANDTYGSALAAHPGKSQGRPSN